MTLEYFLTQKDFDKGTLRLRHPGFYKLLENIEFHPNPENNFFPSEDQKELYPLSEGYFLGFFAAITIESGDVELDLNNFTIEYSKEFNLKQRFGSIIELGSSPFIPKEGPGNFGDRFTKGSNIVIKNGTLGRSPHHGIHGNDPVGLKVTNILIENFEVAGISINGGIGMQFSEIIIKNNSKVNSLSAYSQSKFSLEPLRKIVKKNPECELVINNKAKTGKSILEDLENEIICFENHILKGHSYDGIFKNDSGLLDGNVYGLVLNTRGVVINEFKEKRDKDSTGNETIFLENIIIKNLKSNGKESKVLGFVEEETNYGKNVCKGFAGDVLDFDLCTDKNGSYKGNILSNSQLLINKYGIDKEKGTCNIPKHIYKWVSENEAIENFIAEMPEIYWVDGVDSMAHKMKGNIGLFISQGKNIYTNNILIDNIENVGETANSNSSQSIGIALVGSEDLNLNEIAVTQIESLLGKTMDFYVK